MKVMMNERLKVQRSSENLFRDLGFAVGDAQALLLRARLMSEIRKVARSTTRARAAKRFSVTQPNISAVLRGKIDKFSLDTLVSMLANAGIRVEMKVQKAA